MITCRGEHWRAIALYHKHIAIWYALLLNGNNDLCNKHYELAQHYKWGI
jgi:hypothetical protein